MMRAALLALALAGAACRGVTRESGTSVLLVTVDTLRADALGAYGRARARTPELDRLAAEGVRFARASAHNVVTLPSHANILSGRYPLEHGVRDNANFRFPKDLETMATLLKARGYRTGAFVSAFPLDSRFGLDRGFDVYDDRFGDGGGPSAFHMQERRGVDTVAAARAWLQAQGDAPSFAWVHLYEPHWPYEPPEPLASAFRDDPYLGEVAGVDAALRPLLEDVRRRGRMLVVLTADHGEALGEHGEQTHGIFAYEATLRVPLVLWAPRLLKPRVAEEPARHVDLLPTVLDGLALPAPPGLAGRSLLHDPPTAAVSNYFESLSAAMNRGWAPLHGVIRGPYKYVDLPLPELYDLQADPGETRNLVAREPQRLEELRGLLRELRRGERDLSPAGEAAEVRERLKSLGYAVAAAPVTKQEYTEEDDPKRLIALDAEIQAVLARYTSGDLAGAVGLCRDLVRRRPMPLALLHLAFLERERGDLRSAILAAKQALVASPGESEAAGLLGVYLNEAGRAREAVALLQPYAHQPSPDLDVLTALGMALASTGKHEEALAAFEQIRRLDPSNAMALVNAATVHLMRGDRERAREGFQAALALEPGLARAHNSLGVIAAEEGDLEGAVARWKQAVALDPRDHQTLYNLGAALRRLGRADEARDFLVRYLREAPPATEGPDRARVKAWLHGRS